MASQRKAIRAGVAALIAGANTAAGARVYASRVLPLRRVEMPALTVYTNGETVDPSSVSTAPRELTRRLSLVIEGWVRGEDADDAMDDLADEIETALHVDPYFGGLVSESILSETSTEILEEGDKLVGLLTLTYAVTYRSLAPEPPQGLDDFITADVVIELQDQGTI